MAVEVVPVNTCGAAVARSGKEVGSDWYIPGLVAELVGADAVMDTLNGFGVVDVLSVTADVRLAIVDVLSATIDVVSDIVDVLCAAVDVLSGNKDVLSDIVDVLCAVVDVLSGNKVLSDIVDVFSDIVDVFSAAVDVLSAIVDVFDVVPTGTSENVDSLIGIILSPSVMLNAGLDVRVVLLKKQDNPTHTISRTV